jgi:hypothetical protein
MSKKANVRIHSTIILCGCRMWSVRLRVEQAMTVLENGLLSRLCGTERHVATA